MQLHILSPQSVGLTLGDSLGASDAGHFRDKTREALNRSPRELFLDCTNLTYIDSTGLGLLMLAQGEAAKFGCMVKLANVVNSHVRHVMGLMQYDQLFPMVAMVIGRK